MKQSPELTAFYNAYNDWLEAGAPDENKYDFSRSNGLCYNLEYGFDGKRREIFEMKEQFKKAGLDTIHPFGKEIFLAAHAQKVQHLDPNRIKWVKAHLAEEVDEKFELV